MRGARQPEVALAVDEAEVDGLRDPALLGGDARAAHRTPRRRSAVHVDASRKAATAADRPTGARGSAARSASSRPRSARGRGAATKASRICAGPRRCGSGCSAGSDRCSRDARSPRPTWLNEVWTRPVGIDQRRERVEVRPLELRDLRYSRIGCGQRMPWRASRAPRPSVDSRSSCA